MEILIVGHRIIATGEVDEAGQIGKIGGLRQKMDLVLEHAEPGAWFIFPSANLEQDDNDELAEIQRLRTELEGRGVQCLAAHRIEELQHLWIPDGPEDGTAIERLTTLAGHVWQQTRSPVLLMLTASLAGGTFYYLGPYWARQTEAGAQLAGHDLWWSPANPFFWAIGAMGLVVLTGIWLLRSRVKRDRYRRWVREQLDGLWQQYAPLHPERTRLRVLNGPGSGRCFPLGQPSMVLGRSDAMQGAAAEIDLTPCEPPMGVPMISRRHAQLRWVGRKLFVEDLNSRNGTWKNDTEKVSQGKGVRLRRGDRVLLADLELVVESQEP